MFLATYATKCSYEAISKIIASLPTLRVLRETNLELQTIASSCNLN